MSTILRQASVVARQASRVRTFASTTVARKDLVQDIYLREIKAYKPTPLAKDAHVGAVKQFNLPPTPKAPAVPADLASELSTYDAAEPSVATAPVTSASSEEGNGGADEFLNFLEQDLPKVVHHH
ncbi:hypothetical protein P691DRAFT_676644 [Macrolepiota fuliginosa MF-IS2]|uniref:ATP synthase complex subunit H-domain-containing protein n=1 Tax=Macrolepiota fuliginosa MF-IS2 TaxID=1400762 RepID=A0A9P5X8X0_9AGAR|nr:hypothetical protein P691DRAFT_676644 [Macrolepiota fuliginosa MF-IS2]